MPLSFDGNPGEYSGQLDAGGDRPEGRGILFTCDGERLVEGRWKDG